ncbi:uncharacterized protein BKA55DRAFT_667188 [Fusarium redolens]|uniref:C2H2 type master regulator of conidiophore development brlA n=1 Tax=Fusarium redolens TaxID=48865 RepID=A0A9P9JUG7_FUSRE|nr:uncharacterized protein BKA55DRAFT_667188 [Fusarium redolens]KAH7233816.1 hypothetical protein BKA55DRAFT_667188 [Fusarium redolens]
MELVENKPTARPFQCDWQSCTKNANQVSKSSSLARHRRVHMGKRPYKCTYDGCSKIFCRKATMVEHQRRSHQYGMNPNDILYDCSSDSEDDEPPLTPQHSAMTWSPRDVISMDQAIPRGPIHRPTSYADFDQPVHGQLMSQQYANRHGIPSNVPRESHGQPIPGYYVGAPTPRRTMTTSGQIHHITERTIAAPIQTSPSTFSTTPASRPEVQACLCKYLLGKEPEYAQVDSRQSMIQYQQHIQNLISQPQQPVTSQAQKIHAHADNHSFQISAQAQQEKWSSYVLPIEATTIRQLPAFGNAVYDSYEAKVEVDDPLMDNLLCACASSDEVS